MIQFFHKKEKYNNCTERIYAMDIRTNKRFYFSISFGRDPKLIVRDEK